MAEDNIPISETTTRAQSRGIYLISPSGAVRDRAALALAQKRLTALGFPTTLDRCALEVHGRFAGTDEQRLGSITRALKQDHPIVMATRGGYGLSRLLPLIDWKAVADSGKAFVGFSDFTAFSLALLAQTGRISFSGPTALADFGVKHVNPSTRDMFSATMRDVIGSTGFPSADADMVDVSGILWGGNLTMVTSLLGTPYMPKVRGGILFLEDVNEAPYRVERMLAQLWHAGVLEKQKAIVLGQFTPLGTKQDIQEMNALVRWLRATVKVPVVPDLPYGHTAVKTTLPVGLRADLFVERGMAHLRFNRKMPREWFVDLDETRTRQRPEP